MSPHTWLLDGGAVSLETEVGPRWRRVTDGEGKVSESILSPALTCLSSLVPVWREVRSLLHYLLLMP